jgi:hypothetical protein
MHSCFVRVRLRDCDARHAVVLIVAALLAVSGCGRLLFDAADDVSPGTCPAGCIADAAAAFDGSVDGADGRWRYVGDRRDHTWEPMVAVANAMVGDLDNRIERCADRPLASACLALPGALLVTSSGTSSATDPAIEYVVPGARVVELALRVHVPGDGVEHRVRLYRNSREDVLFTASAAPGSTVEHAITLDAIPGDRLVVALEARGALGSATAVHLFVSDAGQAFPSSCELAVGFSDLDITGAAVDDLCRGALTSIINAQPAAPSLTAGPFAYHAKGVYLEPTLPLEGSRSLVRAASTVQFWVRLEATTYLKSVAFSDIDEGNGGGLAIQFDGASGLQLEAAVVTSTNPVAYTSRRVGFPSPTSWHFVRVVHADDVVTFCIDGTRVASMPLPASGGPGSIPYLGKNATWAPPNEFIGSLDDVRVFSTALPCNE